MKKSIFIYFCFLLFFFAKPTFAFVMVSQDLVKESLSTWTKAESPYIIATPIVINQGKKLKIDSGTVIKFSEYGQLTINGEIFVGSENSDRVVITSIKDDSVSGDTNNDGTSTVPIRGNWTMPIVFNQNSQGIFTNTDIKYGGFTELTANNGWQYSPMVLNQGGNIIISNSSFSQSAYAVIKQVGGSLEISSSNFKNSRNGIIQNGGILNVIDSTFSKIDQSGIETFLGSLVSENNIFSDSNSAVMFFGDRFTFGGNTFSHLLSYAINFTGGIFENKAGNKSLGGHSDILLMNYLSSDVTLPADDVPYSINQLTIPKERKLVILPGAIIKIIEGVNVDGVLISGSENGHEVVITSPKDDSVGGDSNGDGTTTVPIAGEIEIPIKFNLGSRGDISNTIIRYGGYHYCSSGCKDVPFVSNLGGDLNISKSTFNDITFSAIEQNSGTLQIADSNFFRVDKALKINGGTAFLHNSNLEGNTGVMNYSNQSLDATNNWWGDSIGPKDGNTNNPTNSSGSWVYGQVNYSPWSNLKIQNTNTEATTTVTSSCSIDCFSNVMFLPGFEASRLYDKKNILNIEYETRLWEPSRILVDNKISDLFLDENGKSNQSHIYTRDIIDEAIVPIAGPNIYKSFIKKMNEIKASGKINDWESIPYDWRLSLEDIIASGKKIGDNISYLEATSTPYIIQELKHLAQDSKTGKVTIVAHSNGGILTKALMIHLAIDGLTNLVDKIIFVAVPQTGTPQAIGALLHGFDQGIPLFVSAEVMRELGANMSSAYNLLPSNSYFNSVIDPVIKFKQSSRMPWIANSIAMFGSSIRSLNGLDEFLSGREGRNQASYEDLGTPNILNLNLLEKTKTLHNSLDSWVPPDDIKLIQIAGWGVDTVSGIEYYDGLTNDEPTLLYRPNIVLDGDGTVVVPSALAIATSTESVINYWINLEKYNRDHIIDRSHANIFEISSVIDLVRNIIEENASLPEYISDSIIASDNQDKKLQFFLHSSQVAIDLFDDEGNHTGVSTTTNDIEENVPNSSYREFGNVKYVSIKSTASTTKSTKEKKVKAVITKKAKIIDDTKTKVIANLDIYEIQDNKVATSTSFDISISTTTPFIFEETDSMLKEATSTEEQILPLPESTTTPIVSDKPTTDNKPTNTLAISSYHRSYGGGGSRIIKNINNINIATTTPKINGDILIYLDAPIEDFAKYFTSYINPPIIKLVAKHEPVQMVKNITNTASVIQSVNNSTINKIKSIFKSIFNFFKI